MLPFVDVIVGSFISAVLAYTTAALRADARVSARVGQLELKLAQHELENSRLYATQSQLNIISQQIQDHLIRLEGKLDRLASIEMRAYKLRDEDVNG